MKKCKLKYLVSTSSSIGWHVVLTKEIIIRFPNVERAIKFCEYMNTVSLNEGNIVLETNYIKVITSEKNICK